ncbi:hypothetical protein [Azospirillum sp. sgz301742]
MSSALPLHRLVADYLRSRAGERLTVGDIARGVTSNNRERFIEKERKLAGRTTLIDQISKEISAQRKEILNHHNDISVDTSRRPARWFIELEPGRRQTIGTPLPTESVWSPSFIELGQSPPQSQNLDSYAEQLSKEEEITEHEIYEPLQRFLHLELEIVSKRIRESVSSNRRGRNGNKWLHPDIVGMLAPGQGWSDVVRQCSMALPTRKAKLVSVEVKIRLTAGDIRESFFQAVSNSLWANRAYLAAMEIKGEETLEELNMLCALHGLGYISIDPDDFTESRILIPAKEREEVDWANANRIAQENRNFSDYLKAVLNYLQTGHVVHRLWDHTD